MQLTDGNFQQARDPATAGSTDNLTRSRLSAACTGSSSREEPGGRHGQYPGEGTQSSWLESADLPGSRLVAFLLVPLSSPECPEPEPPSPSLHSSQAPGSLSGRVQVVLGQEAQVATPQPWAPTKPQNCRVWGGQAWGLESQAMMMPLAVHTKGGPTP